MIRPAPPQNHRLRVREWERRPCYYFDIANSRTDRFWKRYAKAVSLRSRRAGLRKLAFPVHA